MVIAQLTQLRIAIPLSGHVPGEVPIDCFPKMDDLDVTKITKRVSFAPSGQSSKVPVDPLMIKPEEPSINEQRDKDLRVGSPAPPPGFGWFAWPQAEWTTNSDVNRDPGLKFVASWSAKIAEEEGSSPPPLEQLSPIPGENSQDSITVQVGTTDSEAYTRSCSTGSVPYIGVGHADQ